MAVDGMTIHNSSIKVIFSIKVTFSTKIICLGHRMTVIIVNLSRLVKH